MRIESPRPKPRFFLPERALLVHTKPDVELLRKALGLERKGTLFLAGLWASERLALCGPVLGAPQAALVLENLKAAGVRKVLALGWAGTIRKDLPLGGIFLPEEALSAEGTSAHYGLFPRPSEALFWWVYHELVALGLNFETGKVVSTDAPYREDEAFWARFPGASVVDMETSAIFSVGKALGLEVASLLVISDRLGERHERAPSSLLEETVSALLPLFRNFGADFPGLAKRSATD